MTAIMHQPEQAGELAQRQNVTNPFLGMMERLAATATPESAAAIKTLADTAMQWDRESARKEFNASFCQMQAELPPVCPTKQFVVKGKVAFDYENLNGIMKAIRPTLTKFGFSVRFDDTAPADNAGRLVSHCTLAHVSGHSETNSYAIRAGRSNDMMNDSMNDAGTYSRANRGALCAILNIQLDQEDDARSEGDVITPQQAEYLRGRVIATKTDTATALKFAGAASFDAIRAAGYERLDNWLSGRERKAATPTDSSKAAQAWVNGQPEKPLREWVNSFSLPSIQAACSVAKVDGVSAAHPFQNIQRVAFLLRKGELEFEADRK